MACLEWWAYNLMMVWSGYFGVAEQAAQIILMSIYEILFMVSIGL